VKKINRIKTDILIIGGGTAGCLAGIFAKQKAAHLDVVILEKANIMRSGCLTMGLNAVNAHLVDSTPEDYLEYVKKDNYDVVRSDLVLSIGKRLNRMTEVIEKLGVPLPRDKDGKYISRSSRSIVMQGEQIKPLISEAVISHGIKVYNRTPAYRLLRDADDGSITGAIAFNVRTCEAFIVEAKAVLVCTGGASGIYRPSNPGLARTKTWYCPYSAGSGLAMGIRVGAEMTSFEMRFVALRTKDVIAPTGTLVLGTHMSQCNARGEKFIDIKEEMLGRKLTTAERLLFTIEEHKKGTGPCYVDVSGLNRKQYHDLVESYLNMAPSIALDLLKNKDKQQTHIEVCGSEPYINGGHGMAGFWIDERRRTTLDRFYAAGDIAGGAPKKYITGCFAEAEMAIEDIIDRWNDLRDYNPDYEEAEQSVKEIFMPLGSKGHLTYCEVEERLQKIMEEYAGGSTQNYEVSRDKLMLARNYLKALDEKIVHMKAETGHELMRVQDTIDRVLLSRVLIEHMLARQETRWPCYQTRLDFPMRNDLEFKIFINSVMTKGKIEIIKRELNLPYEKVEVN
jgi:adenylylsulfate reductase subunit A